MSEPTDAGYVVTCVHGTFARNARWTKSDSRFCELLHQTLSEPVVFRPFVWSASNSERARQRGARDLSKHLLTGISLYPSAQHYVIAHSHGGNVALQAVRDTELEASLGGIVCLSVPFIHITPRMSSRPEFKESAADGLLMFGAMIGLAVTLVLLLAFLLPKSKPAKHELAQEVHLNLPLAPQLVPEKSAQPSTGESDKNLHQRKHKSKTTNPTPEPQSGNEPELTVPVIIPSSPTDAAEEKDEAATKLFTVVAMAIAFAIAFIIFVLLAVAAERITEPYWPYKGISANLMIVRSVGDEATGVLTAAYFSAWLLRQIHRLLSWPQLTNTEGPLRGLMYAVLILPSLILGLPIALVSSVCIIPFGFDLAFMSLHLDISVEALPIGTGNWHTTTLTPQMFDSDNGLRHSAIYDDPRTPAQIAEWMKKMRGSEAT